MINTRCPSCGVPKEFPEAMRGKKSRCAACAAVFAVEEVMSSHTVTGSRAHPAPPVPVGPKGLAAADNWERNCLLGRVIWRVGLLVVGIMIWTRLGALTTEISPAPPRDSKSASAGMVLRAIYSDVSSIESDVSSIKSRVSNIESDASKMKSDLSSIERGLSTVEVKIVR